MLRTSLVVLLCFVSCSFVKPPPPPAETPRPYAHLFLQGSVTDDAVNPLVAAIDRADSANTPILLEIDSDGGAVIAGFRLAKAIERARVKVVCVVDGDAMSMGSYVLESCPVRLMTKRSVVMIHAISIGEPAGLTPLQSLQFHMLVAPLIKARTNAFAEHYARRAAMSSKEILAKIAHDTDWFLNWEEAYVTGMVDDAVDLPSDALKILLQK